MNINRLLSELPRSQTQQNLDLFDYYKEFPIDWSSLFQFSDLHFTSFVLYRIVLLLRPKNVVKIPFR